MESIIYDKRYESGAYREKISGCELARWHAVRHFIQTILKIDPAGKKVLDFGAGSGLHVELWEKSFPGADLSFCDISHGARARFKEKHAAYADQYFILGNSGTQPDSNKYDIIVSVEVMEHVLDLRTYLSEICNPSGGWV